jgi:hypothetical protein
MDTTAYGHEIGQKIKVEADVEGTPLDREWRDRMSERDSCHVEQASKKTKDKGI